MTCRATVPATGDACGKPATHVVTFVDASKALVCHACALALEQTAQIFKASIKVEGIT